MNGSMPEAPTDTPDYRMCCQVGNFRSSIFWNTLTVYSLLYKNELSYGAQGLFIRTTDNVGHLEENAVGKVIGNSQRHVLTELTYHEQNLLCNNTEIKLIKLRSVKLLTEIEQQKEKKKTTATISTIKTTFRHSWRNLLTYRTEVNEHVIFYDSTYRV